MQLQSYFNPATGVLIWCVLVLLFGLGFSIGLARWYNTWYAEEKQKAKQRDEAQKEDSNSNPVISEVEKLATAACPFAGKYQPTSHAPVLCRTYGAKSSRIA